MQKYISALVLFLLGMPVVVFAVNLSGFDIALPNGITISSAGGSAADTMTINTDNVTFELTSGQSIHLTAASRNILNSDQSSAVKGCSSTQSTLDYELPDGTTSVTIIVTPSTSTCSTTGGSGGGGGGGGGTALPGSPNAGGGGSSPAPAQPATTPAATVASPQVQQTPAASVSPVFNANLRVGSRNNDVTRLQTLLGQDASVYPEKIASGYFGPKTLAAVKRFQKKYGIRQTGTVGPLTRSKLGELYGGSATPATPATPAVSTESPAVPATPAQPASNAAQINDLQALIQSLQSQLNALSAPKPAGGSISGGCNTAFNSGLICLP